MSFHGEIWGINSDWHIMPIDGKKLKYATKLNEMIHLWHSLKKLIVQRMISKESLDNVAWHNLIVLGFDSS